MFKENSYYEKLAVLDTLTRLLQTGHFLQLPKGCEAAEQRREASPRSGQKIVKGQRLKDSVSCGFCRRSSPSSGLPLLTDLPESFIHSFTCSFVFFFPLRPYSLSSPILSHCFHQLFPPPLLWWGQARSDAQMCTGPSRTGTPLSLYGAKSFMWSVTPYFCLQITPSFLVSYLFTDASFHNKETWTKKGLNDSPKITQLFMA